MKSIVLFLAVMCTNPAVAISRQTADIDYTLTIDSAHLPSFRVEMRIRNAPREFVLASHAHPEYDDKYWRYLQHMRIEGGDIERLDSVRWQVRNARPLTTISYRVDAPVAQPPRAAWRAFLTPRGGVTGGPHAFLYVIGREDASARVRMVLPAGWTTATALLRDADGAYRASDMFTLMESPLMVGTLSEWRFTVANVPHFVYYLRGAAPVAFDSTAFVDGVRRIVEQTHRVFRNMPYRRYVFLFADDAYGGLEHPNSVTMGARSSDLAQDPFGIAREIGHEFFHTWNLMRIKPVEYRGVDYRVQPPTAGLWFSEGLSILYSDLMMRRAGFVMPEPTRLEHARRLFESYANDPAADLLSAEAISRAEYNSAPGTFGNLDPSTHQIGEVLGTIIDLMVRDATDGQRTMDDVMRLMDERFHSRGFTGTDIERVVSDVCGCNVTPFFEAHIRGGSRVDINRYLSAIGYRQVVTRTAARAQNGELERDYRIRAWQPSPNDTLRIMLWNPNANWSRAGLLTNDRVIAINGTTVKSWPEFRAQLTAIPMGRAVHFDIVRNGRPMTIAATMSGFERMVVTFEELPNASERQRRLRADWLAGR